MANYNKYQKLMLFERVKGTTTWYPSVSPEGEPTYKKGEIIEVDSPDCGAPAEPIYRWYVLPNSYMCDEELHIKYQEKVYQVSTDGGLTWKEVEGVNHMKGEIIERDSVDCGFIEIQYRWENVDPSVEYFCDGVDQYYYQVYQVSNDNGETWEDVVPRETRVGELIETQAVACGYDGDWILTDDMWMCEWEDDPVVRDNCFGFEGRSSSKTYRVNLGTIYEVNEPTGTICIEEPLTTMTEMFNQSKGWYVLDLRTLDVSNVTSLWNCFREQDGLTDLYVANWDTSRVNDMHYTFYGCKVLDDINISKWDTLAVETFSNMFNGCTALSYLNLSEWMVYNASNFSYMFWNCKSLGDLGDISQWETYNMRNAHGMFGGCQSLTSLDLSGWYTSDVTDVGYMFYDCVSLETLDLSGWDLSKATTRDSMFSNCTSLKTIYARGCNSTTITRLNNSKPSKTVIITD